ncbi:DUF4383 domain-containing protein [Sphingomonas sp. PB2P19]|uniref:DUF4383 domain-containing protein n=1 Tax=Sphingomonas rhamnosi TaxID=3096156 RepID=UPI002FC6F7D3
MTTRNFALVFGIVFLLAGISGFIPGLSPDHMHPGLSVNAGSRLAFGLFPVNVLHNLIHIAFGIWGLLASRALGGARGYARSVAVIYGVLTVMGLIPSTDTTFGLVPIYGNDIGLHAVLALVAAYFGFVHRDRHDDARV